VGGEGSGQPKLADLLPYKIKINYYMIKWGGVGFDPPTPPQQLDYYYHYTKPPSYLIFHRNL